MASIVEPAPRKGQEDTMEALIVEHSPHDSTQPGACRLAQVPRPQPGPGEALVRVRRVGVCNTDLEIIKGYYKGKQAILGHEFVGVVVSICPEAGGHAPAEAGLAGREVREAELACREVREGSRVVGEINVACDRPRECDVCGGSDPIARRNHCPQRTVMGILGRAGCFAEYITLPVKNLLVVDDAIPDEEAVFAEPLGAAFRIVEQVSFTNEMRVAVLGDGKLGTLIAQVLREVPHRSLTVFGHHGERMVQCLQPDARLSVVADHDQRLADFRDKFDLTVEATGTVEGLGEAAEITRPLGTVVLKSTCANGPGADFSTAPLVVKELTVLGSRCGNLPWALRAMVQGKVHLAPLVTRVFPFRQMLEAIEMARDHDVMKVQVVMDG